MARSAKAREHKDSARLALTGESWTSMRTLESPPVKEGGGVSAHMYVRVQCVCVCTTCVCMCVWLQCSTWCVHVPVCSRQHCIPSYMQYLCMCACVCACVCMRAHDTMTLVCCSRAGPSLRQSCSKWVSFELRYGTWLCRTRKAWMTSPSAERLLLIDWASFNRTPVAPDLATRSEPARSTRLSRPAGASVQMN